MKILILWAKCAIMETSYAVIAYHFKDYHPTTRGREILCMKVDLIPFTNGNFPIHCILHSLFKIPEELMALFFPLGYLSFPEMPTGFLMLDLVSKSALFSKHPSSLAP